ncbi:IMPACT family protein [Microvirga subterranea]|uniref:Putative YigZ family protein n=1 Tax=Microvirga subterranea TaxID=186651 RepID=A0A370HRE3_9HYPH|nr:YigZ family protein [Microvirga subterranea]RDI61078.1 putative YigZ family protein [Microvirga subterranea]
MLTLEHTTSFEQIIKKSRFVATAGPIGSEQAGKDFLAAYSDRGANHNCWAWRIGQNCRSSDDGEPSGTAGKPILQAIDRLALDHVAVVVTRWFGGVLLGSGGLVRAYGGTAAACLRAAQQVEVLPVQEAVIAVPFSDLALVKARLSGTPGVRIHQETFTGTGATLTAELPEAGARHIVRMITDLTSGRASVRMDPKITT